MASNTTYGDWMRPMPGGIRNIGIPLTIAGMGVLTCTLLVSMASVVAAIAILVVGMGVILVLAIRDREHRNMVDRAVEKRTWMAAQRTGANLYRSGLLAPIDGGKAMLPGILSRVVLTSALDGLGREFCLVRHAHTGEYSLLLSCQPQGASLADDDVEDSYVASWAGLMESLASETGVTQLAVTVDTAPDSGVRFRRTLSKRIVEDAPELAARAMAQIMDQYAAGGASNDVTLTLTFRYTDRDGKYLEAGEAARRISLLLPSIREQIAQSGDDVVAAVLATTWTSAFAAKNAADVLAEEGLQPRRNHVIIMDEMHRALRASPLMVEKLDLLTRLNRQWGVGQIMITHTFKDLMCMETPAQNTKARGFVERSEIKVLGALSRIEVDRYLRGECGLPVSRREEDMLEDWATPVNFGSDASHKGLGRFLIKLGGLPGIPINVEMCPLEKSGFNDTNLKWHA